MSLEIWNKIKRPPQHALKQIGGGRLKGMTDINPQWRLEAMTELFGPCGVGWKYEIVELWPVHLESGEATAFARVNLYIKQDGGWSDPIPGIGGSMLVAKEKSGLYVSDEAYKMATTDALSVAMKTLGMGADVYAGRWDGSKYADAPPAIPQKYTPEQKAWFDAFMASGDSLGLYLFSKRAGIEVYTELFNSFPNGKKTAEKDKARSMESEGQKIHQSILDNLGTNDMAVLENIEGLSSNTIALLKSTLSAEQKAHFEGILKPAA